MSKIAKFNFGRQHRTLITATNHLRQLSKWRVSKSEPNLRYHADRYGQNPRTRLNTISRKRLIVTGTKNQYFFPHNALNQFHTTKWYAGSLKPSLLVHSLTLQRFRIKKPKTSRYPSLNGTDPKFRRNHRHALHGTMKALVSAMAICLLCLCAN